MCLRRTPTALGSDVVCSTDLEEVVVNQAENSVVVISSTETAFFNRMDGVQGGNGRLWRHFVGGEGVRLKSGWLLFTVLLAYSMVE